MPMAIVMLLFSVQQVFFVKCYKWTSPTVPISALIANGCCMVFAVFFMILTTSHIRIIAIIVMPC